MVTLRKTFTLVALSTFILWTFATAFGSQTEQEMAAQMAAADTRQSPADTTAFKTPLKTFQRYLDRINAIDFPNVLDCFTQAGKASHFETTDFTPQEIQEITAKIQADGFSPGTVVYFLYQDIGEKTKITARISSTKETTSSIEELAFILVDTPSGWKIDALEIDDVRN
jgi:hypothetical protein